jgi:hypothetical protein
MATTPYTALLPEVLPLLASDPSEPVTINAIKQSVIEFCQESHVWKFFPDPENIVAGEPRYTVQAPNGADVASVMTVTIDGEPVDPASPINLDEEMPKWRTDTGTPKYWTQTDTDELILVPAPDANGTLTLAMTLALQPDQRVEYAPRWLIERYRYKLAWGAVSKLMLMPNKPWTDMASGAYYASKFMGEIANARADAVHGLSRAPLRVRAQH